MLTESMTAVYASLPHSTYEKHLKPHCDVELCQLESENVGTYRIWVALVRPWGPDIVSYIEYKA